MVGMAISPKDWWTTVRTRYRKQGKRPNFEQSRRNIKNLKNTVRGRQWSSFLRRIQWPKSAMAVLNIFVLYDMYTTVWCTYTGTTYANDFSSDLFSPIEYHLKVLLRRLMPWGHHDPVHSCLWRTVRFG